MYTEIVRNKDKTAQANVSWNLKNMSNRFDWGSNMQLVPLRASPEVRVDFNSDICRLEKNATGTLELLVNIPKDFAADHLILLLRLTHGENNFVGPPLLLFVKIVGQEKLQRSGDETIESQILNQASLLCDQGYGTFDRCMMASKALGSDIEKAKVVLSALTFAEGQHTI